MFAFYCAAVGEAGEAGITSTSGIASVGSTKEARLRLADTRAAVVGAFAR